MFFKTAQLFWGKLEKQVYLSIYLSVFSQFCPSNSTCQWELHLIQFSPIKSNFLPIVECRKTFFVSFDGEKDILKKKSSFVLFFPVNECCHLKFPFSHWIEFYKNVNRFERVFSSIIIFHPSLIIDIFYQTKAIKWNQMIKFYHLSNSVITSTGYTKLIISLPHFCSQFKRFFGFNQQVFHCIKFIVFTI